MPVIVTSPIPGAEIAPVAALMGDPARAVMLTALLDGRALAAGELANLAGISPATASAHLTRLLDGGLVTVVSQGRHRYYRLAGHQVAAAIEALSHLSTPAPVRSLRQSRQAAAVPAPVRQHAVGVAQDQTRGAVHGRDPQPATSSRCSA